MNLPESKFVTENDEKPDVIAEKIAHFAKLREDIHPFEYPDPWIEIGGEG